jgi:hypothetical protein
MFTNDNDFDLNDRLCEPPAGTPIVGVLEFPLQCAQLRLIEVSFGMLVYVIPEQKQTLESLAKEIETEPDPSGPAWSAFRDTVDAIVRAPYNQPQQGVHWVSGEGCRPNFSAIDAALLGVQPGPALVEDGEEPVFDEDVHQITTSARGFVSERERAEVTRERYK